jgi:hypothetical protein
MQYPGMERLREHLRRHNRWVLLLTVLTFLFAAILWAGLYVAVYWLVLVAGTVARPFDFQPAAGALARGFAAAGILLCLSAWIARRLRPNEAARDHKRFLGHFLDVLLAVPRLTLSIFGTGGAAVRLSDSEMEYAWLLLRRMNEAEGPVPVQALPVDIPDSAMRGRIVLGLQLCGLVEVRPTSSGPVLAFQNQKARRLAQDRVRLRI